MTRQLRESELRVRNFLDNSADWVGDGPGWRADLLHSGPGTCWATGPDEVLGRSLFPPLHDREADAAQLCAQVRDSVGCQVSRCCT